MIRALICYLVEPEGESRTEWKYANAIARLVHIPITRVSVSVSDLLQITKDLYRLRPFPHVCWVVASQFAAARAAKKDKCDLLMMGVGSDELFGPYAREAASAWAFERLAKRLGPDEAWARLLGPEGDDRSRLLFLGNISPFSRHQLQQLFPDANVRSLLETDVVDLMRELREMTHDCEVACLTLQLELELRSSDVLMAELNAASALAGIRVAYPFYDKSIVELAAQIPLSMKSVAPGLQYDKSQRKIDWEKVVDKHILRLAFRDVIPSFVNRRVRCAYTLPFGRWMHGSVRETVATTIKSSSVWEEIRVHRPAFNRLLQCSLTGDNPWRAPMRFWLMYQLASWWSENKRSSGLLFPSD